MAEHTIWDRDRRVVINGELIAEASSRSSARFRTPKDRWVEYRLFRLATRDAYVVSTVGRSAMPGERDRWSMRIAESPAAVVRALEREVRPGVWELPFTARRLLMDAAVVDQRLEAL